MCDLEDIGDLSMFRLIRSDADLSRILSTLDLRCEENDTRRKWKLVYDSRTSEVARKRSFPDESVKIEDTQIHSLDDQTYYQ